MTWTSSELQRCPASAGTTSYGLVLSDGRFLKLDDAGNRMAANAYKSGSRWTRNQREAPEVRVSGSLEGDTLHVEGIR